MAWPLRLLHVIAFQGLLRIIVLHADTDQDDYGLGEEEERHASSSSQLGSHHSSSHELTRIQRMQDISSQVCWGGDFSIERCCMQNIETSGCWDDKRLSFQECCPNADCWDGPFKYSNCCDETNYPLKGNSQCWFENFTYERCCKLTAPGSTWAHSFTALLDTSQFYGFDEFYTDAQYGEDFGYYSTGRVIRSDPMAKFELNEFSHFTTYPMAMSPHFGNVMCRLLLVMWLRLGKPSTFRCVEMGAGNGQLASDVKQCVETNSIGADHKLWNEWKQAFEYTILERSPALAQRQSSRGHFVVQGDAQMKNSCHVIQQSFHDACWSDGKVRTNECCGASNAQPCWTDHAMRHRCCGQKASVVLSNELVDAFAPVKLRFGAFDLDSHPVDNCSSWQEVKLVHMLNVNLLRDHYAPGMGYSKEKSAELANDFIAYTRNLFCSVANSTVARAAYEAVPRNTTCLALVMGVFEVMETAFREMQMQTLTHNVVYRFRKDESLRLRLAKVVGRLSRETVNLVAIPKEWYRKLRKATKGTKLDDFVILGTVANRINAPLTEDRCKLVLPYLKRHKRRINDIAKFYLQLGYPTIQVLLRPGEDEFIELANCVTNDEAYVVTIDYGASFETLVNSLTIDPSYDGIFIPPIPQSLLQDLPECHTNWPVCAGRVDLTTFIDFTNLAAKGQLDYNWTTLFYGPQNLLETTSDLHINSSVVPGYSVVDRADHINKHIHGWYGHDREMPKEMQRWTSFKALVQRKGGKIPNKKSTVLTPHDIPLEEAVVLSPSWPLDQSELDSCWIMDPTNIALPDWVRREGQRNRTARQTLANHTAQKDHELGIEYASNYEDAQWGVRVVDWLVRIVGCEALKSGNHKWQPWYETRWEVLWPKERLKINGPKVMNAIVNGTTRGYPFECLAAKTFKMLCQSSLSVLS